MRFLLNLLSKIKHFFCWIYQKTFKKILPRDRLLRYTTIFIIFLVLIFAGKKGLGLYFMMHYQPPALTVNSGQATKETWQSYLTAISSVVAIQGSNLSSEVSGVIKEINLASGQMARKGDIILRLNSEIEEANVKDSLAKLKLAEISHNRDLQLFNKKASTQSAVDVSISKLREAEATHEIAKARLHQKVITAPFDGKIGIRSVGVGDYVSPGTPLISIQALHSLYIRFHLPEQNVASLYIGQEMEAQFNLPDQPPIKGVITAIDSRLDPATRNILVEATIPNTNLTIYPGMFAQSKIWLKGKKNVISIPETAITYSLYGDYVYLIQDASKEKNRSSLTIKIQYVKVGEHRNGRIEITDGLHGGEEVVTSGQLKLRNGANVTISQTTDLTS